MGTTNIVKFAGDTKAQVQSDNAYTAATGPATVGFVDGPADPTQVNKALRQSSAVAAAVARLATDPAQGDQPTFNDSEDAATLAIKLRDTINAVAQTSTLRRDLTATGSIVDRIRSAFETFASNNGGSLVRADWNDTNAANVVAQQLAVAVYNRTDVKLARVISTLFKRLLAEPTINTDSHKKFTDEKLASYSDAELWNLVTGDIYKFIMTRKGILANPPVSDWTYLENLTDVTTYTDLPGYVAQREYRVLANGMVEVRVGFYQGFLAKNSRFTIGYLPISLAPVSPVTAVIVGSKLTTGSSLTDSDLGITGDVTVVITSIPGTNAVIDSVPVSIGPTYTLKQGQLTPWSIAMGRRTNPFDRPRNTPDANLLSGSVVSLTYMPRLPFPYAYYKGPATP